MIRGAVFAALLAAGPAADSGAKPSGRMALEPLDARGVAPALVEAVEARVCDALAEGARAEVVCPADVAAVARVAEVSAFLGECATDECVARVDRARAADRRVTGTLSQREGGLVLSLVLVDAGGAPVARAEAKLPRDLDALLAAASEAAKKLVR